MARTLAEIDADLARAETRITNLIQGGQQLQTALTALDARLDAAIVAVDGKLDDAGGRIRKVVQQARREIHNTRVAIVALSGGSEASEPRQRPNRPGRNPLVKMVPNSQGKLVARSRLTR